MSQALLKVDAKIKQRGRPFQKGVTPPGARPWVKGQTGNPGGRNGHYQGMMTMAREATAEATAKLIEIMRDDDPRVAGWAADKVLERAWGKPRDYDAASEQPDLPPIDPAQFSPAQRAQLRRMLELLLKAMPAEAPPEVIDAAPQDK